MNVQQSQSPVLRIQKSGLLLMLAVVLMGAVTGCQTTRQGRSVEESGFLGDYSQLQQGKADQAKLLYIAPQVNWQKYTAIYIAPVCLWKSTDPDSPLGKLSLQEQQQLVDMFYTSMRNQLEQNFTVVDRPAPNTLIVRSAITMAKKSAPVRNLVSTVMPIGLGLSTLKAIAFGKGIGVGDVQAEMELLDGQTHQRLAAAVDRRVGTKALRSKFDSSWGDVRRAFEFWAERLDTRLIELRGGKIDISD